MTETEALAIILLLFNLANSILHGLGIYLLVNLIKLGNQRTELVYFFHLSLSLFIINVLEVAKVALAYYGSGTKSPIRYIMIIQYTGVSLVYFIDMILLTADRLLEIVLNIKYPVYWNSRKAWILLNITWVLGFVMIIIISVAYKLWKFDWELYFYTYFYPIVEFSFVLLATATYIVIFKKFKRSRISPTRSSTSSGSQKACRQSTFTVFRRSKFFISVLLILTFAIFMVAADMTFLFVVIIEHNDTLELRNTIAVSYAVSNLIDAIIYIFVKKETRNFLVRRIRHKLASISLSFA